MFLKIKVKSSRAERYKKRRKQVNISIKTPSQACKDLFLNWPSISLQQILKRPSSLCLRTNAMIWQWWWMKGWECGSKTAPMPIQDIILWPELPPPPLGAKLPHKTQQWYYLFCHSTVSTVNIANRCKFYCKSYVSNYRCVIISRFNDTDVSCGIYAIKTLNFIIH